MIFFFFSSRRRHTRFDCDWSSDVCSSDLIGDSLNEQNNLGLTLSGQSGSNLFKLSMVSNGSTTGAQWTGADRKSTRLNSSHSQISYAVFCLKKKKKKKSKQ